MPDRSVVVRLRADIDGFKRSMDDAAKATRRVGDQSRATSRDVESAASRMMKSAEANRAQWNLVGKAFLIGGGAIATAVGAAVKSFADFDAEMSTVRAVSGASSQEMQRLSEAALKAGADTKFSASEAAQATGELAKVGISTSDILSGALTGSLNLAAAGNLDLAQAAEISGQAMKLFGLAGKDVPRIADTLAAGANKSAADVTDLAQAMAQGGLVAAQTGLTLEDTVGTLSAFADNALMGSDAGTSFKTMLQRLNPQSAEAQALMDKLGLSAYDAQGNFVGITAYAGKLQAALGKMSVEQRNAAMQTLFGSDAVRAANVLYKLGADGVRQYVGAVKDQGAAARVAAVNMDNLSGDVEQLKGSLETALIKTGEAGNGPLRELTQSITSLVNKYGDLPEGAQKAVFWVGATGAAAATSGGLVMLAIPKYLELVKALQKINVVSATGATRLRGIGVAAGVAAVAIPVATAAFQGLGEQINRALNLNGPGLSAATKSLLDFAETGKATGALAATFGTDMSGFGTAVDALSGKSGKLVGLANSLDNVILPLRAVPDVGQKASRSLQDTDQALASLVAGGHPDLAAGAFDKLAKAAQAQGVSLDDVKARLPQYADALAGAAADAQAAASGSENAATGIAGVSNAAADAQAAVKAFDDALKGLFDQTFGVESATDAWHSSLNDLKDAVTENGRSTKGNTDAAIANREALRTAAQRAYDLVQAYADTGASADDVTAKSAAMKAEFIKQARDAGFSKTAAEKYADALDEIPGTYAATFAAKGGDAVITTAKQIRDAINNIPGYKSITIASKIAAGRVPMATGGFVGFATGGLAQLDAAVMATGGAVRGPGTSTSDSIPARLSAGEYVVKADAVQKYGVGTFDQLNSMRFASGGFVRASGVASAVSAAPMTGLVLEGTLDLGGGLEGRMRAVVRGEIGDYDRQQSRAIRSGSGRR